MRALAADQLGWLTCALALLLAQLASAYYVPGTYPAEFHEGEKLQAHVNSLKSFDTEMPYEYYTLPFCKPADGVKSVANTANPGTLLEGLRIETSPYTFLMKVKQTGLSACPKSTGDGPSAPGSYGPLTAGEVQNLKHKIDQHYRVNMILDNLPITVYDLLDENQEFVRPGFELGYQDNGKYYIYNHLVFNILITRSHGEYIAAMDKTQTLSAGLDMDTRRHASRRQLLLKNEQRDAAAGLRRQSAAGVAATALTGGEDKTHAKQLLGSASTADNASKPYYMVVGFEVSPCSIARDASKAVEDVICGMGGDAHIQAQEVVAGARIVYTYDVYWQESNIKWTSRWDAYLRMPGGQVHWFSIMNSVIVVLIMATLVALILIRTVRRDLSKYEQLVVDSSGLEKDESGWKLVTGDVFRAPSNSMFLAVQVASGFQIIATSTVTLLLATLGLLSPASRGALLTATLVVYVWLAVVAGFMGVYVWGWMQRSYSGWPYVCGRVSLFFPGIVMAVFTFLNLVIHHTGTTGAVPIGMFFVVVAVWFLVSIPLVFVGGYMALRVPIKELPVKTNQIPRHIPPPPLAANPILLFLAAGVLPFGTIFIELYFAMSSVWLGYFYYLFGFAFVIGLLTVIITAEIAVLCTYVQLCAEDYNWWWQSFHRGGSVALYVAAYALGYLLSSIPSLSGSYMPLIFLSYMIVIVLGSYLACGAVGFVSSYLFVHYIFSAVKAD